MSSVRCLYALYMNEKEGLPIDPPQKLPSSNLSTGFSITGDDRGVRRAPDQSPNLTTTYIYDTTKLLYFVCA